MPRHTRPSLRRSPSPVDCSALTPEPKETTPACRPAQTTQDAPRHPTLKACGASPPALRMQRAYLAKHRLIRLRCRGRCHRRRLRLLRHDTITGGPANGAQRRGERNDRTAPSAKSAVSTAEYSIFLQYPNRCVSPSSTTGRGRADRLGSWQGHSTELTARRTEHTHAGHGPLQPPPRPPPARAAPLPAAAQRIPSYPIADASARRFRVLSNALGQRTVQRTGQRTGPLDIRGQ
jgi:hypothetical protein